jgi:hypothetical protein
MTFLEMLDICRNVTDETDQDDQIDVILKSAINEAYRKLRVIDKRITKAYIPIIDGIATLPEDFMSLVSSTPTLTQEDIIVGRNQIVTSKTGTLTLLYSYFPDDLVADTDEPELHILLQNALTEYANYRYYQYKKKVEVANLHYSNYIANVKDFSDLSDYTEEIVRDVNQVSYDL